MLEQVCKSLDEYDVKLSQLECDGFTRICSYLLKQAGIPHTVYIGCCQYVQRPETLPVHYWIVLEDGTFVDYRLRMWFGQEAPHGFFKPACDIVYDGHPVGMEVSKIIFDILVATGVM